MKVNSKSPQDDSEINRCSRYRREEDAIIRGDLGLYVLLIEKAAEVMVDSRMSRF